MIQYNGAKGNGNGEATKAGVHIADLCPVYRFGLARILNEQLHLHCCGETDSVPSTVDALSASGAEILALDLRLNDGESFDLIQALRADRPQLKILVVSLLDEVVYAERVLRAGASGYLSKLQQIDEVLFAFETVLAGKLYLSRQVAAVMAGRIFATKQPQHSSRIETLSDRELQVFHMLGSGRTSRKISEELRISLKTVEAHREHIKSKLGLSCSSELIQCAAGFAQGDTYLQGRGCITSTEEQRRRGADYSSTN